MLLIATELQTLVTQYRGKLLTIPEADLLYKPSPAKWSKKEILGHLVDSAQTNIRRFVVAQYEESPHIVYNQDAWVAITAYQQYDTADLISLWALLQHHISAILKNMPPDRTQRQCLTGSLHTLEWLAQDYIRHLKHHLHQLLGLEPVPYP